MPRGARGAPLARGEKCEQIASPRLRERRGLSGTRRAAAGRAGTTRAYSAPGRPRARARRKTRRAASRRRRSSSKRPRCLVHQQPTLGLQEIAAGANARSRRCRRPPTTRWQGMTIGSRLSPHAWPTARASAPRARAQPRRRSASCRAESRTCIPHAALELACLRSAAAGRSACPDLRGSAPAAWRLAPPGNSFAGTLQSDGAAGSESPTTRSIARLDRRP